MVETPAPAVAVDAEYPAVKPDAVRLAAVMPAIVMPAALEDASLTVERVIVVTSAPSVNVKPVAVFVVSLVAVIAMFLPSKAERLTAPVVVLNVATTPV